MKLLFKDVSLKQSVLPLMTAFFLSDSSFSNAQPFLPDGGVLNGCILSTNCTNVVQNSTMSALNFTIPGWGIIACDPKNASSCKPTVENGISVTVDGTSQANTYQITYEIQSPESCPTGSRE
jgi:hypothetical protein